MPRKIDIIPFAENGLPSDYLFTQRKYYATSEDVYLMRWDTPKPIDIWYERPLWGKVDTKQRVIFPFGQILKPIGNNLSAINFVADAYTDFKRFVLQARAAFRTSVGSFIDVDRPKKAYEDSYGRYQDYFVDDLQPVFVDDFLNDQRRREINNFKNFMDYYLQYVDINLSVPHTLCGFILSPRMSHRNSGLVINLSNDNPGKDSEKWTKYLSNDFFQDYAKIAASFGFYINKNTPWSIVANLNSNRLKQYMANYALTNAEKVFDSYYFQAEEISYYSYKNFMVLSYLSLITSAIANKEVITYHNCIKRSIERSSFKTKISFEQKLFELGVDGGFSVNEFVNTYPEEVYFKYYIHTRLKEEAVILTRSERKSIINKIINILNTKSIKEASMELSNYLAKKRSIKFKSLTDKKFSLKITSKQPTYSGSIFDMFDTDGEFVPMVNVEDVFPANGSGGSGGSGGGGGGGY